MRFAPGLLPGETAITSSADLRWEVESAIARFQPGSAAEFCRSTMERPKSEALRREAEELLDRSLWVDKMKSWVIESLNRTRPSRAELKLLGGRRAGPVEILKATTDGLVTFGPGGSRDVAWDQLEPSQVTDLALGTGGAMGEAERFGLAVYAGATGQGELAKTQLRGLRGGSLEIPATRELSRLGGLD